MKPIYATQLSYIYKRYIPNLCHSVRGFGSFFQRHMYLSTNMLYFIYFYIILHVINLSSYNIGGLVICMLACNLYPISCPTFIWYFILTTYWRITQAICVLFDFVLTKTCVYSSFHFVGGLRIQSTTLLDPFEISNILTSTVG